MFQINNNLKNIASIKIGKKYITVKLKKPIDKTHTYRLPINKETKLEITGRFLEREIVSFSSKGAIYRENV